MVGWAVLAVAAPAVAFAAVAVGRGAVGGSSVVEALTPAQVSAALSSATGATPDPDALAGGSATLPGSSTRPSSAATHPGATATGRTTPSTGPSGSHGSGSTPSTTKPTSHPSPSGTPSPTQSPVTALLTSPGGSVVAQCSGAGGRTVYLVSWSPAQGFTVNGVARGPGEEAEIEFESDAHSYTVNVHCSNGYPVQSSGYGGDD